MAVSSLNLTASVDELVKTFGCSKEDIKTQFSIRLSALSGLPEAVGGGVSCEVEGKTGGVGGAVKDWLGLGKKKDQEPLGATDGSEGPVEEVEAAGSSSSTTGSASTGSSTGSAQATTSKEPEKPKKRLESIPVRVSMSFEGNPQPSFDELVRMQDRLKAFDQSDRDRQAREEAQNVLESYTYFVRDFLENNDYDIFGTKTERDEISKLLKTTREWMESSGEAAKATRATLREKLQALKKLVEPIQARRKETESRPELVKSLRTSLEDTKKLVDSVREQIEKAAASASSTVSSVVSEVTESSSTKDDLDELDDATGSSSSKASTETPSASPYLNIDLAPLDEAYESVVAWLTEKEAEQAKLKPHDEPVLRLKDIEAKATQMANVMQDLLYKKLRADRSAESSKKPKTSKPKSTKSSKKSSTSGSQSEETQVPEADEAQDTRKSGEENLDDLLERINKASDTKHDEL